MPAPISDVNRPLPPFDRPTQPREPYKAFAVKALVALLAAGVVAGCASRTASLTPQNGTHVSGLRQASNISRALPAVSPTPVPAELAGCSGGGGTAADCQVKKKPTPPSNGPTDGLSPAQLRAVYGLPPATATGSGSGALIAIVAAYDNSKAEDDLNVYRKTFGLPPCTSGGNHCFTKVQMKATPGGPPPAPKPPKNSPDATTWSDEIALDLAMASAACPTCRLLLVEALGQDLDSLADAVNYAASYQPVAISNSWGVLEGGGNVPNIDPDAQAAFYHPGIAITASAGDLGGGQVEFPASSPYVTAVGGTTLKQDGSGRGWAESDWTGSGNGCSIMIATPAWQPAGACSGRIVPDVSMLADSSLGVAVYSSAEKGWVVLGGTSIGAPFVAGLYGAANDYGAQTVGAPAIYANLTALNAVGAATVSPNGLTGF